VSKRLFRYRIVVGFLALFAGFVVVRYAYLAATPAKADAYAAKARAGTGPQVNSPLGTAWADTSAGTSTFSSAVHCGNR